MKNVILSLIYVFILFVMVMNVIYKGAVIHYYPTDEKIWLGMAVTAFGGFWVLCSIEKFKK